MNKNKLRIGAAALAASALLLAACGGDSSDSGAGSGDWVPGPLDEFQARIWGFSFDAADREGQEEAQARMDAESRMVENLVAECMAEYGFNYIPNESTSNRVHIMDEDDSGGVQWGTLEFAEEFGFAISTDPWRDSGDDLDGMMPEIENEWFDPNQEQVDAMSDSERDAWWEALWGPPQEGDWDPELAGCFGRAQNQVWSWSSPEQFSALEAEMNGLWEQIEADPRLRDAQVQWANCMADEGFDGLTSAWDLQDELWNEWAEMNGWVGNDDLWANWDWDLNPEGPVLPAPSEEDAAEFRAREIAAAVASFTCDAQADIDGVRMSVNHDHQQRFVDLHGAELEAWAQYAEANRAEREQLLDN
ncbi:MAG: hypothetical protein FWG11_04965 [Promicromonosporaceae bacterium]|nr:hypothetical protein [Promicromonosporaceae bacterium]